MHSLGGGFVRYTSEPADSRLARGRKAAMTALLMAERRSGETWGHQIEKASIAAKEIFRLRDVDSFSGC